MAGNKVAVRLEEGAQVGRQRLDRSIGDQAFGVCSPGECLQGQQKSDQRRCREPRHVIHQDPSSAALLANSLCL